MEDGQIIDLYWQRDEEAIRASGEKYGAYCHAVAQNILHNPQDAEECVSDTWLRAWGAIPPQRPARLRMFFAKITRNLALDRWKARTADKRGGGQVALVLDELEECIPDQSHVEDALIAEELGKSVSQFVRGLSPREGNVFIRRYFFAEPVEDIARRYGLSGNHVMVILSRTRQKLKKHLDREGFLHE